jgi:hypothetical protein
MRRRAAFYFGEVVKYKPNSDSLESFFDALASTPVECTYLNLSSLDFLPSHQYLLFDILKRIASSVGTILASVDCLDLSNNRFTPQRLAIFLSALSNGRTYKVLDLRNNDFFSIYNDDQNVTSLTLKENFSESLYNSTSWHAKEVIFSGSELIRMSQSQLNNFAKIFPWYVKLTVLDEQENSVVSENTKYFRKKIMSGFLHHAKQYDESLCRLVKYKNLPEDVVGMIASYLSPGGGVNTQNKYLKYSRTFFSYKMAMDHDSSQENIIQPQQLDDIKRLNTRPIEIALYIWSYAFVFGGRPAVRLIGLSEQQQNVLLPPILLLTFIIVVALKFKNQLIQSAQSGLLKNIIMYMQLPFKVVPFNPHMDDNEIAIGYIKPHEDVEDEDEEDAAFRNHPK